jgi:hypothetical protein
MDDQEIISYAKAELEPMENTYGGPAYRCAAVLKDGIKLPCVLLASAEAVTELALRRFEETRADAALPKSKRRFGTGMEYRDIVKSFVASGNCVNSYDIDRLEKSPFAIPLARFNEIKGETSMSWTQFTAIMKDGREFAFGTTYLTEFFHMPEGYVGDDIAKIIPHKAEMSPLRERPFFTCHVSGL